MVEKILTTGIRAAGCGRICSAGYGVIWFRHARVAVGAMDSADGKHKMEKFNGSDFAI